MTDTHPRPLRVVEPPSEERLAEIRAHLAAGNWDLRTAQLLAEIDRLRAERPEGSEPDLSGWSAEENAEFEKLYGVQAAVRLRASNDRVWQIVHELRSQAVEAGLDPYQDPMAQRLAAALVQPEPADTGVTHRELLARTYCATCGERKTSLAHLNECLSTEGA